MVGIEGVAQAEGVGVRPRPMPNALSPMLKCAGSTTSISVPQPITCSAIMIANIDPRRSHSSGVKAPRSRERDEGCLLSVSAAMSRPIWR